MAFYFNIDKTNPNIGDTVTLTFYYRGGADVTVQVGPSQAYPIFTETTSENTYSFVCLESWFNWEHVTGATLRLFIYATTATGKRDSNTIYIQRSPISIAAQTGEIAINGTNTLIVTDPYNRVHDVRIYGCDANGRRNLLETRTDISGNFTVALAETAFVTSSRKGQELRVIVVVSDAASTGFNRAFETEYKLTRTAIGVNFVAYIDQSTDPPTYYAITGDTFYLRFDNRLGRTLSFSFTCGSKTLYDAGGEATYTSQADSITLDCLKRWFDDAEVINNTRLTVLLTVSDEMLRETTFTFEVRAGSDMKPLLYVTASPVQPSSWPSTLRTYYVQGYTKARFTAIVGTPTGAAITSVALSSPQIGSLQMTYDSTAGTYGVTTQAPLTANTEYTITVQDQRGLVTTLTASITVLPYAIPGITVDSYRRCRSDQTPDDSGGWCKMVVSYVFAALNNRNSRDTNVSTTGYSDARTLTAYSKTETYFFEVSTEHSFQITIHAVDLLNDVSRVVTLSTAGVIIDFLAGGQGIGLGKVAELSKCVEVNPQWKFKAATIELNGSDLGTLLASIMQRLTNGGL